MFASIPRRSTRVRRSYICTACRCGLLGRDEILSVLQSSSQTQTPNQQLATFSTSTNYAARTRKPGARPAVKDIQKTVAQLNNLMEAFLEDLKGEVKEEKHKGKGEHVAIKTSKIGGDKRERIEKEENQSTPAKGTPPKKKPKPAKHITEKDAVSLTEEQDSKEENPKRARLNRKKRKGAKAEKDKIAKKGTSKVIKIQKVSGGKVPIKKVLNKLPIKHLRWQDWCHNDVPTEANGREESSICGC